MPDIKKLGEGCCGCGACEAVCPKDAVRLVVDAQGFRRAAVDGLSCVECGACDIACPVVANRKNDTALSVWWAKANDEKLLGRSSSGGVFGLLARDTINVGGAVYGAAFGQSYKSVSHTRVDDVELLDSVMRSKYLQSSVGAEIYRQVRDDLGAGRFVLFSGTACQISGLRGYLGKRANDENLLCVDVICHGVPSPRLWSMWVEYKERIRRAGVYGVNFRSKTTGWSSYSVLYEYRLEKDGASVSDSDVFSDDWYMKAFLANASLRASCFDCPAKRSCGSDVTLGDYWGFQNDYPGVDCSNGISAVIANTEKGVEAFNRIAGVCEFGDAEYDSVLLGNPSLETSASPFWDRGHFMEAIQNEMPIEDMMSEWDFKSPFALRAIWRIKGLVKKILSR